MSVGYLRLYYNEKKLVRSVFECTYIIHYMISYINEFIVSFNLYEFELNDY